MRKKKLKMKEEMEKFSFISHQTFQFGLKGYFFQTLENSNSNLLNFSGE